jgi:TIGR03009 family protein
MRPFGLSLTSLLVVGPALWAQAAPPAAPPPAGSQANPVLPTPGTDNPGRAGVPGAGVPVTPGGAAGAPGGPGGAVPFNPATDRLDYLLSQWELKMRGATAVGATVKRTDTDAVNKQQVQVWEGKAFYMRPDRVRIQLNLNSNKNEFEYILLSGNNLYEYRSQAKKLTIHQLPPPAAGQVADENQLGILFGMKAIEAKRRYEIRLVKEDQWWIYLEILPRTADDRADFTKARLILYAPTFLPRQMWFEQPSGNQVTWEIPEIDTTLNLKPDDFRAWQPPQGWQIETIKQGPPGQPTQPRVVRPQK